MATCTYAQTRYFEMNDIRYRVITEADGASTYGTVSVAKPEFGEYEDDVEIPNVVKESKDQYADAYKVIGIDDHAFFRAEALNSVKLPASLETMGEWVFAHSSITAVTIPVGNMKEIGAHAFDGCSKLKEVSIPSTVKSIGSCAFYRCKGLETLTINDGVETIGENAFSWCCRLQSVKLPSSVRILDDNAFDYCYRLASIDLGTGLKRIGNECFMKCIRLRQIDLPDGLKEIGERAFFYSGIVEIKLPESIREISNGCFQNSMIRKVTLPERMRKVGLFAFANCHMDNADIPENLWEVDGDYNPFTGTTFDTTKEQAERAKQVTGKAKKLSVNYSDMELDMANDQWSTVEYKIGGNTYTPIIHPTSGEKYGLLELLNKDANDVPNVIEVKNGPYPELYIVKAPEK